MIRRALVVSTGVAVLVASGACGLGAKQADADRISAWGNTLLRAPAVTGTVAVDVRLLANKRVLARQEPSRIARGALPAVDVALDPQANAAAVAQGSLRFVDDAVFERIATQRVTTFASAAAEAAAPSNLAAIGGAAAEVSAAPVVTTTTAPARALRRSVRIVREWAGFDFAAIEDDDRTKHAGSFAINPVALVRLINGVLTGSVKRVGATYEANVSRDKAERKLSEDAREVLDKMFTANAVTRRVFPARFFTQGGAFTGFEVTLRQQISSADRAEMVVTLVLQPVPTLPAKVTKPSRRGTVSVGTLSQLVTTVSGT